MMARRFPWAFALLAAVSFGLQVAGDRPTWLYDRDAIGAGEWWRLWTGHLVHFGWPHFVVDAGLFVILGWLLERAQPAFLRVSLVVLPPAISGIVYFAEPSLRAYGGLSAVNLALLLYMAAHGWQKDWRDWFWPAVLVIYVAELVFENTIGRGSGGGMIRFDDPSVKVATGAHLAATGCGLVMIAFDRWMRRRRGGRKLDPGAVEKNEPAARRR